MAPAARGLFHPLVNPSRIRVLLVLGTLAVSGCDCGDELGVLNASITVEPTMIDFGRVPVSSQKTVKLKIINRGSFVADVSGFVADAPFVAPTITSTVATFDEIEVDVILRPTEIGMVSGTLVFATNDPEAATISVPLMGEGIEAAVVVDPPAVDFGEVLWNSQTQPVTVNVTVRNPGTDAFTLSNFRVDDNGGGAFTADDMGVEQVYNPGGTATFSVTYMPNAMGPVSGVVRFDTTTMAAPTVEVPLTGTAVGPELEVCASATGEPELCTAAGENPAVQMLNVDRNATATGSIRVINAGNRDLTFQASLARMEDELSFNPDPSMAGQVILTPNEERVFDVTYTPADYEFDVQTVIVGSNSATRPTSSVLVRGEVGRPSAYSFPAEVNFQQTGENPPATVNVALSNCGTLPLMTTGAITLRTTQGPMAFTLSNTPASGTMLPDVNCNPPPMTGLPFQVTFDPPAAGVHRAEIDVPTNDPVTPTLTIMVSGTRN
jgi:hypothetical protein